MAEAAPSQAVPEGSLDGMNSTTNGTSAGSPSVLANLQDVNFILLQAKIVLGAMGIIYLGAHAALRRPPSAAPAKPRKPGGKREKEEERFSQGLERSDAIMFPVMAAAMLVGLYYLIKWLKDPAILNKILQWYMSTISIASLWTIYAHGIELVTNIVFPRYWRGWDGLLRKADQEKRVAITCDDVGNANEVNTAEVGGGSFPGPLGFLAPFRALKNAAWDWRGLLMKQWTFRFVMAGIGKEKAKFKFAHVLALLMSLASAGIYFSTTSPLLSNMLGYGMCYGSMLLLSPTDFLTGSLVLVGLFFYDIVMVFYTPYMVTVATTLDVPIKLTFKAAAHKSILGLGDIVLPGMLIGWTLRFDLWLHYMRKIKYESTDLMIMEKDESTGAVITRSDVKHKQVKVPYVNVKGKWGDHLWTNGILFPFSRRELPVGLAASRFTKTYFAASMAGYLLGMLVTLAMLLIFKRGQPALLYLVPGVLGSLLVTAAARGEFKELWTYTEDGSLDTEDVVVDLDANGRELKVVGKLENGVVDTTKAKDEKEKDKNEKKEAEKSKEEKPDKKAGKGGKRAPVFMVSIEAPGDTSDDESTA